MWNARLKACSFSDLNTWIYCMYEACPESEDTKVLNMNKIFNLQKLHCEWIVTHNFIFDIVAGIVQTFIKYWSQLLHPRGIEVCRQPFEPPHHRRRNFSQLAWIQEFGENPMFHLQSHWSLETHLLPML